MAEEGPIEIQIAEGAPTGKNAFKTVAGLVESALPPMLTLINHLRKESPFVQAVGNLGVNKENITLDKSIDVFQTAMIEFQNQLTRYGVPATNDLSKKVGGGTRKLQAKKRASTRGSYRRQRY